ncbi:hypothetical protein [Actinophytocola sediminis]
MFAEAGSTWWPVLWGPLFAAIGAGVEAMTGPVHWLPWIVVGLGLGGGAIIWVSARRKVYLVRLTTGTLTQGREQLRVADIAEVTDVGVPVGAKVLGGGWTVPRKTSSVPLRLAGGSVVLAWARDDEGLLAALRRLVEPDQT